jgi:hypothetical protein
MWVSFPRPDEWGSEALVASQKSKKVVRPLFRKNGTVEAVFGYGDNQAKSDAKSFSRQCLKIHL